MIGESEGEEQNQTLDAADKMRCDEIKTLLISREEKFRCCSSTETEIITDKLRKVKYVG